MNDSLEAVAAEVIDCHKCDRLVTWREQVAREKRAAYRDEDYWGRAVPGFGDPNAQLLIVGLAPAAHGANRTGRQFTGDRSGDWLYRALHKAGYASQPESTAIDDGLTLTDAYITAPVKCAPPLNKPTGDEKANCAPFLAREQALLSRVKVIVVLGNIGYAAACKEFGISPRPKFGHGVEVPIPPGDHCDRVRTLLCSYHVSQQNTFTGRLTEPMIDAIFARARELSAGDD